MKIKSLFATLFAAAIATPILACGPLPASALHSLAERAVSPDPAVATNAITLLRFQGPAGLQALFDAHDSLIRQHQADLNRILPPKLSPKWQRLQTALDSVSAQRDCYASHLYWYTNLEAAKNAAHDARKPILSLRLLGNLDEEYSCANSRFFRTTLYANTEVSQYLRDHFILHWQSVRPVPRITIDFGDGRKIERTITGNSIHYVLDANGRPVDGLPGLYGPKAFLKALADAEPIALKCATLSDNDREDYLRKFHSDRYATILQAWNQDMKALGSEEIPMLKSFQTADDTTWLQLARLHASDSQLDASSITLISTKYPTAKEAARMAVSKTAVENPLTSALRNLQNSIAEDTVRNEYQLHSQIHEWFMNGTASSDLAKFNSLVYAKLFLTPDSDPWLGLVPANTITALDNNGLVQSSN